jgi:hypothetical protein
MTSANTLSVVSAVDAAATFAAVAVNVALAEKPVPLVIVTVYAPAFNNGTSTSVVISPFRLALGAGLGMAEADPMLRTVTVPRELNPVPVTVIVSSTAADAGLILRDGFGVEKAVVLPVISPTLADTICVPGLSEPPAAAAGTSTNTVNPPSASVRIPAVGIAFAPPIVKAVEVDPGGKFVPTMVTILPVGALAGVTVIAPLGTLMLTILVLELSAVAPPIVPALSATFT